MGVHLKGDKPEALLEDYRPNEPPEIRAYRLEIYEPTTKSSGKRIINVLSKIQKSSNYSIKFEDQANISEEETLEAYTMENYPVFGSLTEWAFNMALKQDLSDPNALVVVMPIRFPDNDTEFLKPFTFIYRSDQVIDYGFNYYTILLDEKNIVKDVPLNIYLFVTEKGIFRAIQTDPTNLRAYSIEFLYIYDYEEPPAYFLKGDYKEDSTPICYESFVSGILPYWNKAVRMDSDLDSQYNQHMYLERVEMEVECDNECRKSDSDKYKGDHVVIRLMNGEEVESLCNKCNGSGFINGRSPYGVTKVRKEAFDENKNNEFPGVAYIEKGTKIIELVEKKVDDLISKGFTSINLDIIDKVGENQSGVAKAIDRDELHSFISKISDNLFDNILANAFKYISIWRYSAINRVIFPTINKPTEFDLVTSEMIAEEIKNLKEGGVSGDSIRQLELDLIDKKFPNDTDKKDFNKAIIDLDPLGGKNEEEKMNILMSAGVTREQYIVSSNIRNFLLILIEKDPDFLMKSREDKLKQLQELAKQQIVAPIGTIEGTE
jgi:hypothetical protein